MKKIKGLLYCTKAKPSLMKYENIDGYYTDTDPVLDKRALLNGKIVAECDFEVEEIEKIYGSNHACFDKDGYFDDYADYATKSLEETELLKHSCLTSEELENYLQDKNGYAIHIKNLHIFDEHRELKECHKKYDGINYSPTCYMPITTAPQNMMRVWLYENGEWVMYILISIQPQWMCLILNRIKDVEVRKVVLKEMLENASK